jgi:hypothetical protein
MEATPGLRSSLLRASASVGIPLKALEAPERLARLQERDAEPALQRVSPAPAEVAQPEMPEARATRSAVLEPTDRPEDNRAGFLLDEHFTMDHHEDSGRDWFRVDDRPQPQFL